MIGNVRGIDYKTATQVNFPGVVESLLILTVVKETHTSVYLLKVSKICGASLVAQMAKNLPATQRPGFDLWVGKIPGGGNGHPCQYSCLENPMERGAWKAISTWDQKDSGHD